MHNKYAKKGRSNLSWLYRRELPLLDSKRKNGSPPTPWFIYIEIGYSRLVIYIL